MYDEHKQYLIYDETHLIADFGGYLGLLQPVTREQPP